MDGRAEWCFFMKLLFKSVSGPTLSRLSLGRAPAVCVLGSGTLSLSMLGPALSVSGPGPLFVHAPLCRAPPCRGRRCADPRSDSRPPIWFAGPSSDPRATHPVPRSPSARAPSSIHVPPIRSRGPPGQIHGPPIQPGAGETPKPYTVWGKLRIKTLRVPVRVL